MKTNKKIIFYASSLFAIYNLGLYITYLYFEFKATARFYCVEARFSYSRLATYKDDFKIPIEELNIVSLQNGLSSDLDPLLKQDSENGIVFSVPIENAPGITRYYSWSAVDEKRRIADEHTVWIRDLLPTSEWGSITKAANFLKKHTVLDFSCKDMTRSEYSEIHNLENNLIVGVFGYQGYMSAERYMGDNQLLTLFKYRPRQEDEGFYYNGEIRGKKGDYIFSHHLAGTNRDLILSSLIKTALYNQNQESKVH